MSDFTPTYVDVDQFSVPGDVTYYFPAGIRLKINCSGSVDHSSVESSSYGGGITTITLTQNILTDPVTAVWIPPNHPDAVAIHDHSDDDSGGTGVVGTQPDHEWSSTSIRFTNPSGWGDWTDIQGPQGIQGETGETGAAGTPAPQDAVSIMKSTFSQVANATIGTTDASDEVIRIWVNVATAASGGSPTMTIGWTGNTSILAESSEIDLTTVGIYEITPMQAAASKTVIAYISADSQTFSGTIYAWYGQPS